LIFSNKGKSPFRKRKNKSNTKQNQTKTKKGKTKAPDWWRRSQREDQKREEAQNLENHTESGQPSRTSESMENKLNK